MLVNNYNAVDPKDIDAYLNKYLNNENKLTFYKLLNLEYTVFSQAIEALTYHFISIDDINSLEIISNTTVTDLLNRCFTSYSFIIEDPDYISDYNAVNQSLLFAYMVIEIIQLNNSEFNKSKLSKIQDYEGYISNTFIGILNNDVGHYDTIDELKEDFNKIWDLNTWNKILTPDSTDPKIQPYKGLTNSIIVYLKNFFSYINDADNEYYKLFIRANNFTSIFNHNWNILYSILNLYCQPNILNVQTKKMSVILYHGEKNLGGYIFTLAQLNQLYDDLLKIDLCDGNFITNFYYAKVIIRILLSDAKYKIDTNKLEIVKLLNDNLDKQMIKLNNLKVFLLEKRKLIRNIMKVI